MTPAHATPVGPLTPHLYAPTPQRPIRAKLHRLSTDQRVLPHRHPWAQLAMSSTGVVRLTVEHGTYLVPPSRALWIPPGVREGAWKYIYDLREGTEELYRLDLDPTEQKNVASTERARCARLRQRLAAWAEANRRQYGRADGTT